MLDTEKKRLTEWEWEYLSIGITEGGKPRQVIGVPWEKTCNAYSMKTPDVYLSIEDISDESVIGELLKHTIVGCYIMTPLDDYSFLERFTSIRDLSIEYGDKITSLDFLAGFCDCELLFLHNARLKNLDPILDLKKKNRSVFSVFKCVGLCNCEVDDISRFEHEKFHFSEFLIWRDADKDEKEKWSFVTANTKRYYEL